MTILQCAVGFLSGRGFSNLLSLAGFVLALCVFIMGLGLKAEYGKRTRDAIFGYHMHLCVYFEQLKTRTYSRNGPTGNLYLLGTDNVRHLGAKYEKYAEDLSVSAQKMLDYLSSKPTQFPGGSREERSDWNNLMKELIRYLLAFVGYKHNITLPELNSEKAVIEYGKKFQKILKDIEVLIEKTREENQY